MKLVIVESPSKAKTIEKYLGKDYIVDASGGHIRDLPAKRLGVDVKHNYAPQYELNPDKKDVLKRLQQKLAKAESVYLATDPDREGEAISWHLAQLLGLPLDKKNRIEFNEISQKAVKKALDAPREINVDLVNAQQARRVLDRLVGYKLSPFLCRHIREKLSAGRVQSVALRLVVEREREIRAFVPKEFWNITALLCLKDGKKEDTEIVFRAALLQKSGKKFKPENKAQADAVAGAVLPAAWQVLSVKRGKTKSHAPAPFNTSSMQQDASNKLSMTAPAAMKIAQELYEGVQIKGEGQTALVTYIRTDSLRVSPDAQAEARAYIAERFGPEYIPEKPNFYKSKGSAQDAHEAIRPISLTRTPDSLRGKIDERQYKLYKLIYERFTASQMSDAEYDTLTVDIGAAEYTFRSTGRTQTFKGYTAIYDDYKDKDAAGGEDEDGAASGKMPPLKDGDALNLNDLLREQKFTKPPARYSDASLIKAMEEKGIGRPSTYASIIGVLLKRDYTAKEGKYLVPTELAFSVIEMLVQYFDQIVDVEFTARMENNLDEIEGGGKQWQDIVGNFYPWMEAKLKKADEDAVEVSDVACDLCGAMMVYKIGRYGKFLGCPGYPTCKNIKNLDADGNIEERKPATGEPTGDACPDCGAELMKKNGRFGEFVGCSAYPKCKYIKNLSDNPFNHELTDTPCPACGAMMHLREGRYGKYLSCSACRKNMPLKSDAVSKCPKCGKSVFKRNSKKGKVFYGCEGYPGCDFVSWDPPTDQKCPKCGGYTVIKTDKQGGRRRLCAANDCDFAEDVKA